MAHNEELWHATDQTTPYSAELERTSYSDGSVNYTLHVFDDRPNRADILMYLDENQLKALRTAIDYALDEKDRKGNNEDSNKSLFPNT